MSQENILSMQSFDIFAFFLYLCFYEKSYHQHQTSADLWRPLATNASYECIVHFCSLDSPDSDIDVKCKTIIQTCLTPPRRLSSYDDGEENAAHPHMMICRLNANTGCPKSNRTVNLNKI